MAARYRYTGDDRMRESLLNIVESFDLLMTGPALVKDDVKSTVIRVEAGGYTVYCKRFRHGGFLNGLKNQFRRSKALMNWRAAADAEAAGIPTPVHLAAIEERTCGLLVQSFLFTEALAGSVPVSVYYKQRFHGEDKKPYYAARYEFIRSLARFLASLHRRGMSHSDVKGANILVGDGGDGYEFHVLDLDSVSFGGNVSDRLRIRNLVQLNNDFMYLAGPFDRLRFFIYYLKESAPDLSRAEKRSELRRILELTAEKVERWNRERTKLERKGRSKHLDSSIRLDG